MKLRERVCKGLVQSPAVRVSLEAGGGFRLKTHKEYPDAPLSPIYIDLRVVRSLPDLLDDSAELLEEVMLENDIHADLYADIPIASSPMVTMLCHRTRVPQITPREPKGRGLNATVEGIWEKGQTAALFDDLVTRSDSKGPPTLAMREVGLIVKDCVVLIDREQGGPEILARDLGLRLYSAFTMRTLLQTAVEASALPEAAMYQILEYPAKLETYIQEENARRASLATGK